MPFVTPVAWQPPFPLVYLQSLRVQQLQHASTIFPARSLLDGRAVTDKGAKEEEIC